MGCLSVNVEKIEHKSLHYLLQSSLVQKCLLSMPSIWRILCVIAVVNLGGFALSSSDCFENPFQEEEPPNGNATKSVYGFLSILRDVSQVGLNTGIPQIQMIAAPIKLFTNLVLPEEDLFKKLVNEIRTGFADLRNILYEADMAIQCSIKKQNFIRFRAEALTHFENQMLFYNEARRELMEPLINETCQCHKRSPLSNDLFRTGKKQDSFPLKCTKSSHYSYKEFESIVIELRFVTWALVTFETTCKDLKGDKNFDKIKARFDGVWTALDDLQRQYFNDVLKIGFTDAINVLITDSHSASTKSSKVVDSLAYVNSHLGKVVEGYDSSWEKFGAVIYSTLSSDSCNSIFHSVYADPNSEPASTDIVRRNVSETVQFSQSDVHVIAHRYTRNYDKSQNHRAAFDEKKASIMSTLRKFKSTPDETTPKSMISAIRKLHDFPLILVIIKKRPFNRLKPVEYAECFLTNGLETIHFESDIRQMDRSTRQLVENRYTVYASIGF